MKIYSSIQEMQAEVLRLVDSGEVQLVSWDVFDTLLVRRLHPDFILEGIGYWIDSNATYFGRQKVGGLTAYHEAYKIVAERMIAAGLDGEVTVDEIYLEWAKVIIDSSPDQIAIFAESIRSQMELYEGWSCMAYEPMRPILEALAQRGVRMIVTSDMYLGERCIVDLLSKSSLSHFFAASYVSGDSALLKRTGRLFDHVLKLEKVDPTKVIHIGDSEHSDGIMAAAKGIKAFVHREDTLTQHLKENEADRMVFLKHRVWGGPLAASFSSASLGESGTFAEGYGRRILGPIYTSFIHRVLERCKAQKIEKIYFVAREGAFLKRIGEDLLDLVYSKGESRPDLRYLLVSRLSTMFGASKNFGLREILIGQMNLPASLKNLLGPLKFRDEEVSELAAKYGIPSITDVLPHFFIGWPPFIGLLEDQKIRARWSEMQISTARLCERYLEEQGFFSSDRVAIVDVGWAAQIQESIDWSIREREDRPQIFGLYLGTSLSAHWRKTPHSWVEWCLCDELHFDWQAKSTFEFRQGLEIVTRSPHGTVIGYSDTTPVLPQLKDEKSPSRVSEAKMDPLIAQWQAGVYSYARQYSRVAQMLNLTADDTMPYARDMVERMVRFPLAREADDFLQMENFSDLGSDVSYKMGRSTKQGMIISRRKLHEVIRPSFWKYGSLAALGGYIQQFWWALVHDARHVPHKLAPRGAGIVFHAPAELIVRPNRPSGTTVDIWHRHLEDEILVRHQYLVEESRIRGVEFLRRATRQLSLREVIKSYSVYRFVLLYFRLTARVPMYRGGVRISRYIQRWIYLHPRVEKFAYGIKRFIRR